MLKLRINLDARYPLILAECGRAIELAFPEAKLKVNQVAKVGCFEVYSYWKHWTCLFPQHGPGRKHEREIRLASWQEEVARRFPAPLVRGLIHSDGCRVLNRVNGKDYPRYLFTNYSAGIRRIFCEACDLMGVAWTRPKWHTISIARSASVAQLDTVVGPKR